MKTKTISLLVITLLISSFTLSGKNGKIKLGKLIYYQGEISNKKPIGDGTLYIKMVNPKNENYAVVSGSYNNFHEISNAITQSKCLPTFKIEGNATVGFSLDKGKEESFNLEYHKTLNLVNDRDTLVVNSLSMNVVFMDDHWVTKFKSTPLAWMPENWEGTDYYANILQLGADGDIIAEKNEITLPRILQDLKWNVSHSWLHSTPDSLHANRNLLYTLTPQCEYVYDSTTGQFLNVKSGLAFTLNNTSTWSGYRILSGADNVIIIHKRTSFSDEVEVKEYTLSSYSRICRLNNKVLQSDSVVSMESFLKGDMPFIGAYKWEKVPAVKSYKGTIKNCNEVVRGNFSQQDLHYLTGEYIEYDQNNGVSKRILWRNGETETQLKERLIAKGLTDNDLLTGVLSGKIDESRAIAEQTKRNKWKKYRENGTIPPVQNLLELEDYVKSQPSLLGNAINNWKTVVKLCSDNPEIAFYRSQDPLDIEIYRRSAQYPSDVAKFADHKNSLYLFRVPIKSVDVDGSSFNITIDRGWYRRLCKTIRENYLFVDYHSGNSTDGTFTFVVPIKRQHLKAKYFDFAPETITIPSQDLSLLKKVRDTNLFSGLELYLVLKPGSVDDPTKHISWQRYYLNPIGLYLFDKSTGKLVANISDILGNYSRSAINAALREQKQYEDN